MCTCEDVGYRSSWTENLITFAEAVVFECLECVITQLDFDANCIG